jgi:hypothetical protein
VRFDHIARFIVNANHGATRTEKTDPKFNHLIRIAVLWRAGVAEIVAKGVREE